MGEEKQRGREEEEERPLVGAKAAGGQKMLANIGIGIPSAPPMDTMFEEGIFGSSAAGLRCCIEWMEQSEMRWERVTD